MRFKFPNYLTIGRIIIVPIFVFTFYLPGLYGDILPEILEEELKKCKNYAARPGFRPQNVSFFFRSPWLHVGKPASGCGFSDLNTTC